MCNLLWDTKQIYRGILQQARLLAYSWDDATIFRSHAFIARLTIKRSRAKIANVETQRKKRQLLLRTQRQLAAANAGWPHAVERALEEAYGRRGTLKHLLFAPYMSARDVSQSVDQESSKARKGALIPPALELLLTSPAAQRSTPVKASRLQAAPRPVPFYRAHDDPNLGVTAKSAALGATLTAGIMQHRKLLDRLLSKTTAPVYVTDALPKDVEGSMSGTQLAKATIRPLEHKARGDPSTDHTPQLPFLRNAIAKAAEDGIPRNYYQTFEQELKTNLELRRGGWSLAPTDYQAYPRAKRRQWSKLLRLIPLPISSQSGPGGPTREASSSADDAEVPALRLDMATWVKERRLYRALFRNPISGEAIIKDINKDVAAFKMALSPLAMHAIDGTQRPRIREPITTSSELVGRRSLDGNDSPSPSKSSQ